MPGYSLARTETPPTEAGYMRTGNYILYRRSSVTPVGAGGHFQVKPTSVSSYTAYQMFRTTTGAELLFTSSHLFTGNGRSGDDIRMAQTQSLIPQSTAQAGVTRSSTPVTSTATIPLQPRLQRASESDGGRPRRGRPQRHRHAVQQPVQQRQPVPPLSGQGRLRHRLHVRHARCRGPLVGPADEVSGGKFVGTIPSDHNPVWAWIAVAS